MFKKILLVLVALVVLFGVFVALQPSEYRVERSTMIAAPASAVFPHVNDFRKWQDWSPWAKLDPDAKITFEGPESGEGTIMAWNGNKEVGEGKMTLVESKPDEAVKIKVGFTRPFEGGTNSAFEFSPKGDETEIVWAMHGNHGFVEKAFFLLMGGPGMMGADIEKGLSQLKSTVEQGEGG